MTDNVVRFSDYDKRSREPDAAQPRDPAEADVIAFPIVRFPRVTEPFHAAEHRAGRES